MVLFRDRTFSNDSEIDSWLKKPKRKNLLSTPTPKGFFSLRWVFYWAESVVSGDGDDLWHIGHQRTQRLEELAHEPPKPMGALVRAHSVRRV